MSVSTVPPEFSKILNDFIKDIYTTFPEYIPFIEKWRKPDSSFQYIQNVEERNIAIEKSNKISDEYIFKFCSKKYPPRFFDFLYKNEDIFKEDSEIDTEFLPHVYFKSLRQCFHPSLTLMRMLPMSMSMLMPMPSYFENIPVFVRVFLLISP